MTDDFDFSGLNLEFFQTTPPKRVNCPRSPLHNTNTAAQTLFKLLPATTDVQSRLSSTSRRIKLAQRIADTDVLITQHQKLEQEHRDLKQNAQEIHTLYETERQQRIEHEQKWKQMQVQTEVLDAELVRFRLQCDQMKAQLAEREGPLPYSKLAVQFVRLAQRLDDERSLHWQDQSTLKKITQYCEDQNLHVPQARSPKKRKTKSEKAVQCATLTDERKTITTSDQSTQCEHLATSEQGTQCERLPSHDQSTQHSAPTTMEQPLVAAKELRHQSTQCECPIMRSQGTQHIGTTTTRGTSTTCFIKQHHVGTSFPERMPLPSFKDMLLELDKWKRIKPISPIIDPPPSSSSPTGAAATRPCRTIGTCTYICNVQRNIDFMPLPHSLHNTTAIKRSNSRPPSRLSCEADNIKCETSLNSPANIALGNLHLPTFHELWQVFGKMLYGLLQQQRELATPPTTTTSVSTPHPHSENMPDLQNLMRSLYDNMQQQKEQDSIDHAPQTIFEESTVIGGKGNNVPGFYRPPLRHSTSADKEDALVMQHIDVSTSPIKFIQSPPAEVQHTFLKPSSTEVAYKVHLKSPLKVKSGDAMRASKTKCDKMHKKRKKIKLLKHNCQIEAANCMPELEESACTETEKETSPEDNEQKPIEKQNEIEMQNTESDLAMHDLNLSVDNVLVNSNACTSQDAIDENPVPETPDDNEEHCTNSVVDHNALHIDEDAQVKKVDLNLNKLELIDKQYNDINGESTRAAESIANVQLEIGSSDKEDDDDCQQLVIDEGATENEAIAPLSNSDYNSTNNNVQSMEMCSNESLLAATAASTTVDSEHKAEIDVAAGMNSPPQQPGQQPHHKRGRKRKCEIYGVLPSKRSERLRAKQTIVLSPKCPWNDVSLELSKYTSTTFKLKQCKIECETENDATEPQVNADETANTNFDFFQERSVQPIEESMPLSIASPLPSPTELCDSDIDQQSESIPINMYKDVQQQSTTHTNENEDVNTETNTKDNSNLDCVYSESPASPAPLPPRDDEGDQEAQVKEIPLELLVQRRAENMNLLDRLAECHCISAVVATSAKRKKVAKQQQLKLAEMLSKQLQEYLASNTLNPIHAADVLVTSLYAITDDVVLLASALVDSVRQLPRPEMELGCAVCDVPPNYVSAQLTRLDYVLYQLCTQSPHAPQCHQQLLYKIETLLFNCECADKLTLNEALNLTQLYLLTIAEAKRALSTRQNNPARLFIAKCLYYHQLKAIPMIYEVLCCFPTVLPHREERAYDRSDPLITVIQHTLMCTNYDMEKRELRTRELLSMLRFVYHFEPFRPTQMEVLQNLLDKIRAGHLTNIAYAMAIYCKRLPPAKVATDVVHAGLLPMANEFYALLLESDAHDERVAALLECISMVVKPFPLQTDVSVYLAFFARFLNAVARIRVQEAAVQAILRLQRFGFVNCYQALQQLPTGEGICQLEQFQLNTQAMLRTFVLRKPLSFWRALRRQ